MVRLRDGVVYVGKQPVREVVVLGEGAVGAVFGYNYAVDNFYNNGSPGWQQQDAYHHSVGDYYNLWEGQIGSGFTADDIHGTSWMLTLFRNRFSGRDPALRRLVHARFCF